MISKPTLRDLIRIREKDARALFEKRRYQDAKYKYLCIPLFDKMKRRNQHVIPLGNVWAVKGEGTNRFAVITETQRDAITVARELAKQNRAELIIHGKDGKIRDRDSYGNDLNPPKDKRH